jgi:hypothetical protein
LQTELEDSGLQRGHRPMALITGLYLFLFLMTAASYGQPVPLFGRLLKGDPAAVFVALDSLVCLYIFIGLWKRQLFTWYLLISYNLFEILNTLATLWLLPQSELELAIGKPVETTSLIITNLVTVALVAWVTSRVFRLKSQFTNRSPYLF